MHRSVSCTEFARNATVREARLAFVNCGEIIDEAIE